MAERASTRGTAEGTSLVRVLIQLRGDARRGQVDVLDHVRRSPDTTVKATLFEDSAAMAGCRWSRTCSWIPLRPQPA